MVSRRAMGGSLFVMAASPAGRAGQSGQLAYILLAVHCVPSRSIRSTGRSQRTARQHRACWSAGPVRAAGAGVNRLAQVLADGGVGLADPRQRAPDRLAGSDPRAFTFVRE